jgi:glyoxylase-like metal-dependent hydrolase (beta-lactamase superfamily II)
MIPSIRTFVAEGFGQNAYLIWEPGATGATAIDPGGEAEAMADVLSSEGLWLEAILLTHAHLDHIEGVAALVRRTGARVHLHPDDRLLYDHAPLQAERFGLQVEALPAVDAPLSHGQQLTFGGLDFEVRHTPGHSPGHVIFHLAAPRIAFVGDVIFLSSIGRTDLPGGSFQQLIRSIREQVLTLPDETTLFSGHGPPTTVGHERVTNPFLIPHHSGGLA